LVKASW